MALPASGAISLSDVNVELGLSATAQISMGGAAVRGLFGAASGAIGMTDGYGKANEFAFSIASTQTNANLRTLAVNAGWDQSTAVVATINSGIVITSNSTSTPALTINGSFPGGVELVNNGTIVGRGGNGGAGGNTNQSGAAGAAGGKAMAVLTAISIRNNGTIAGGGGGGGGGGADSVNTGTPKDPVLFYFGGSGGGGGRSSLTNSSGGAGGSAANGSGSAGGAGTFSSAGARGTAYADGGNGGGWGANGAAGQASFRAGGAGGAGGAALTGNSFITWLATGTRNGSIS